MAQLGYVCAPSASVAFALQSGCAPPWVSRLGGAPSYYGSSAQLRPSCASCGQPLLLLAQVWAPAGARAERALLLFACNAVGCANRVQSARVLRTQAPLAVEVDTVPAEPTTEAESTASTTIPTADGWGSAGAWGVDAVDPTTVSILDSVPTIAGRAEPPTPVSTCEPTECAAARAYVPPLALATCDEPLGDDDEDSDADGGCRDSSSDEGAGGGASSSSDGSSECVGEDAPKVPDSVDENWAGEKYEKTPAALRFMLAFTERMRRLPAQCLRYEWAAAPLWPVPPPSLVAGAAGPSWDRCAVVRGPAGHGVSSKSREGARKRRDRGGGGSRALPTVTRLTVPRCACGAERQFEMQLLPQAIAELNLDSPTASTQALLGLAVPSCVAPAPTASDAGVSAREAALDDSLDFLSLLVFSCEASCDDSNEEFVVAVADS